MVVLMDFSDVLARDTIRKPHLLLGNGFSRACRNDLFSYTALFDSAKKQGPLSEPLLEAFTALETDDFESVMRNLVRFAQIVNIYVPNRNDVARQLCEDVSNLREALAKAISANHPKRADEISDAKFRACREFLLKFNCIYTLNYDLLLYWAMMRKDIDNLDIRCDDGFCYNDQEIGDYVTWSVDIPTQNVYYLHGALHIFDGRYEVQKYTWSNTGIALVDQIRQALDDGRYPIYVAEGSSESKWEKVLHNAFLMRGYRSLSTIGNSLVIFGHSLHENDQHVLDCIERSKVTNLYVSIFGNSDSEDNQRIIKRAQAMADYMSQHNQRLRLDSPRSRPPEGYGDNLALRDSTAAQPAHSS